MKLGKSWGLLDMIYDENTLYNVASKISGTKYSLFDLAKWKNGLAFKNINFSDTGIPVIKIAELNSGIGSTTAYTNQIFSDDVHLVRGDLLFSWSGNPETSIDIFRFKMSEGWLNQHIFKVTPYENIVDRDYFYFLMKFLKPYFKKIASNKQTTGLGHVTISDLKRMIITLPPMSMQKEIVAIIKPIDDKVELNNKINDNLLQQVMTIFTERFPTIMDGDHLVSEYILPKRGKGLLSKDAIYGSIPVVAGGLKPSTYHNVSNTKSPVITISASGANAGFVRLWNQKVWSSDSSFIDNSVTEFVYFWYALLKARQQEIFDSQTGSAQPHIYPKHIGALKISSLDTHAIKQFNDDVRPLFDLIGRNEEQNTVLSSMRDSILPKLMSGELNLDSFNL